MKETPENKPKGAPREQESPEKLSTEDLLKGIEPLVRGFESVTPDRWTEDFVIFKAETAGKGAKLEREIKVDPKDAHILSVATYQVSASGERKLVDFQDAELLTPRPKASEGGTEGANWEVLAKDARVMAKLAQDPRHRHLRDVN